MRSVLPPDELKRRIDAFRTLKGLRQVDLAAMLEADGFGKQDVGRLERGDLPLTRGRRRSLAEHLGVPERWLVDEHLDLADYLGEEPAGIEARLRAIELNVVARNDHDRIVEAMLHRQTQILARIEALLNAPQEGQVPDESVESLAPKGLQALRESLTPKPATRQPSEETHQPKRSGGRGA